jgi:Ser-tRNA(Ala) deacylase AlaX
VRGPATDCLYLRDDQCVEAEARVVDVHENALALNRTCFYPGGGGQPPDEGFDAQACGGPHVSVTSEVGRFSIVRTENKGKTNKRLYVRLDGAAAGAAGR